MSAKRNKKMLKGLTDLVMIAGLISCVVSTHVFEESKHAMRNGASIKEAFSWGTLHCVLSLIFIGIIVIHVWQHRDFIRVLLTRNLYLKNKMTTLTLLAFLLTVLSISLYLNGFTFGNLHFHSMIAHVFVMIVVIHLILNFKKLVNLFKIHKLTSAQLIENQEIVRK